MQSRRALVLTVSLLTYSLAVVAGAAPAHAVTPTCFGLAATIVGTNGSDILTGTPGNDVIVGLKGDDRINGNGGKDYICGGGDNDYIYNTPASPGFARLFADGGNGSDEMFGTPANDVLKAGRGGGDHFHASLSRSGGDRIDAGPGGAILDFDTVTGPVNVDLSAGTASGPGFTMSIKTGENDEVLGTAADDHITGDDSLNTLLGRGGDDQIFGLGGDDDLNGGDGTDTLDGGDGRDLCVNGEIVSNCES